MSDLYTPEHPEPDAATGERDTRDNADAFALLDHSTVRLADYCPLCNANNCRHVCGYCRTSRPCPCDEGGEISQRESRQMFARAGLGPSRYQR